MKELDVKLFEAIKAQDLNAVKNLLKQGANINVQTEESAKDWNIGWTPLMHANALNKVEIAQYMIDKDADLSVKNANGTNILMAACDRGRLELVKACIEKGIDINARDKTGRTALMIACKGRTLEDDGTKEDYLKIIQLLIESGAEVNAKDNDGETALHHAAFSHFAPCLALLIEHGANINEQDKNGVTPLINAITEMDANHVLDTVKVLVEKGADVDIQEHKDNDTALRKAVMYKRDDIVNLIKQHSKKSGGCYIATACYGSYDAPEVLILREYRNKQLSKSYWGRVFIQQYYKYSPYFARQLQNKPTLNSIVRHYLLDKIVQRLTHK